MNLQFRNGHHQIREIEFQFVSPVGSRCCRTVSNLRIPLVNLPAEDSSRMLLREFHAPLLANNDQSPGPVFLEIASTLRGMYGIGSIPNGKSVCDMLSRKPKISTFWMFRVGGMTRVNNQYWLSTGKDILAMWNEKYEATLGTWSEAIYTAKDQIEKKENGQPADSYIDTMGSEAFTECHACREKPINAKTLKVDPLTGEVSFV